MRKWLKNLLLILIGVAIGIALTKIYYYYQIQFINNGMGNGVLGKNGELGVFNVTRYLTPEGETLVRSSESYISTQAAQATFESNLKDAKTIVWKDNYQFKNGDQVTRAMLVTNKEYLDESVRIELVCISKDEIYRISSKSMRHVRAYYHMRQYDQPKLKNT